VNKKENSDFIYLTIAFSTFQGSMCNDCMVVACCGPCAACQEARELTNMGVP